MLRRLTCKRCGKSYETSNKFSMYCSEQCKNYEPRKCVICGSDFLGKVISNKSTCSKECSKKLRERTTLARYGVKNIAQKEDIKKIIQEKRKEQMPEIKTKMRQASLLKQESLKN